MCGGTPTKTLRVPANMCSPFDTAGMTFFSGKCNGSSVIAKVYPTSFGAEAAVCKSDSMEMILPVGKCMKMYGAWTDVSCQENGTILLSFWEEAKVVPPPPPHLIHCSHGVQVPAGAHAALYGSGVVVVAYKTDPSFVDLVSFEVIPVVAGQGTEGGLDNMARPSVHFTALAGSLVEIPGLEPGAQYLVKARAHLRGHSEGNPQAWSNLTRRGLACTAAAALRASAIQDFARASRPIPRTHWIEVYRTNTNGELPDFLDDHNSADLFGQFSTYGVMMTERPAHPVTRYCVEVLDVALQFGIGAATATDRPVLTAYADYGSCMGGDCLCMNLADRMIARQQRSQILSACPSLDDTMMCHCSEESMVLTHNYTGMTAVPLPFRMELPSNQQLPSAYPWPYLAPIKGHWFSHPSGGRCPHGVGVGESGCTWQRAPLSHSVYTDDLIKLGLNATFVHDDKIFFAEEVVSLRNVEVGQRAFESLRLPPCGPWSSWQQNRSAHNSDLREKGWGFTAEPVIV